MKLLKDLREHYKCPTDSICRRGVSGKPVDLSVPGSHSDQLCQLPQKWSVRRLQIKSHSLMGLAIVNFVSLSHHKLVQSDAHRNVAEFKDKAVCCDTVDVNGRGARRTAEDRVSRNAVEGFRV